MGDLTGFKPSTSGLHYANSWPSEPDLQVPTPFGPIGIGDAANGLCGGMAFAVGDLFMAHRQPPADTSNPSGGSGAFNYIVGRLFDSFNLPGGVAEYYTWMQLPTHDTLLGPKGTSDLTINSTMPIVRQSIDAGRPMPLGLVCVHSTDPTMLGHNHQVLAYGYQDSGSTTTVKVYDPNHPNNDTVSITFDHTNPAHTTAFNYSTGDHSVLGFFACNWYSPHDPSALFANGQQPPPPRPLPVLRTSCQPASMMLGRPQTFTVTAHDPQTNAPVAGNVLVNGVRVGPTGTPITHTFFALPRPAGIAQHVPGGIGDPRPPVMTVQASGFAFSPVAVDFGL
jgi:hypothetical protein